MEIWAHLISQMHHGAVQDTSKIHVLFLETKQIIAGFRKAYKCKNISEKCMHESF